MVVVSLDRSPAASRTVTAGIIAMSAGTAEGVAVANEGAVVLDRSVRRTVAVSVLATSSVLVTACGDDGAGPEEG